MSTDKSSRRILARQVPPLLDDLPALLTRSAEHEANSLRQRANALFQQQVSTIDVTNEILPDFDRIRAECLGRAEGENIGAPIERMRAARDAMLKAVSAFADSVASLDDTRT